jgi:hypothetical protein
MNDDFYHSFDHVKQIERNLSNYVIVNAECSRP